MKCVGLMLLLSTYDVLVKYPSTVQKSNVPFPEQLNVKFDALFTNIV